MAKEINIFSGASGLNTVDDPVRLPNKDGIVDLQVAVDVTIDRAQRVSRRKGYSSIASGNYHSLFFDGNDCLVMKDNVMYLIGSDQSLTLITTLNSSNKVDYTTVNNRTYFTNGVDYGYIDGGLFYSWDADTYYGPETNREFSGPFAGSHLAFHKGRMFIAKDNWLVRSELYNTGLFCLGDCVELFESRIRMIKPIFEAISSSGGIFISTEKETFFRTDENVKQGKIRKVANFPAIEWSAAIQYVSGAELGLDTTLGAVWASPEGAILGLPTGQIINLNKKQVIYPDNSTTGFGCLQGYNFIHGLA